MAAVGAKAGESAAPSVQYTLKRLGPRRVRPGRRAGRRTGVIVAAVILVAVAGVAVAAVGIGQTASRTGRPRAMPAQARPSVGIGQTGSRTERPQAMPAQTMPAQTMPAQARPSHSALPGPAKLASPAPSVTDRGQAAQAGVVEVVGVGCPGTGAGAVIQDNAPTGPGWALAGGGWTGNGCDGTSLWTMDPNGNQQDPSILTWKFSTPPSAAQCTLAVFIPTQNALGVSDYSVSVGTGQVVGTVLVSQGAEVGDWFTLGTFTPAGGSLEITTAPVPGASGRGHHGAIAASAASARCA